MNLVLTMMCMTIDARGIKDDEDVSCVELTVMTHMMTIIMTSMLIMVTPDDDHDDSEVDANVYNVSHINDDDDDDEPGVE